MQDAASHAAGATSVAVRRRPRILIAEDDADLRDLLVAQLAADGHRVEAVSTGLALAARVTRDDPSGLGLDLIITDICMPGRTGLDVMERMRSPGHPSEGVDVPVILITAFGDDDTYDQAVRLGAALFEKPFDLDDLRLCVWGVLGRANRRPEHQEGPTWRPIVR